MDVEKKRPISKEEIAEIAKRVKRPENVDQAIFDDVLTELIRKHTTDIQGIENDPMVRNYLYEREIREEERLARIQIKLTQDARKKNNFPSNMDEPLVKHYSPDEIPVLIRNWAVKISEEIDIVFGLNEPPKVSKPKKLSRNVIDSILAGIDYSNVYKGDYGEVGIDPNVNAYAVKDVKKDLEKYLRTVEISEEYIPEFVRLMQQRFERAISLPGKWVGNNMASAQGEASTQQTLNTFHSAGDRTARKQIAGFPKFKTIIGATDAPHLTNMTIFMKQNFGPEQLRLRVPNIQMTRLSDLIEHHRVISSASPMPRWEIVSDVVNGINYRKRYDERHARLNLHRMNPIFAINKENPDKTTGRILEIKLNVKELFFRKIPLSQIANVIEDTSSKIRVVTSPMDIGLLYIYFEFTGIASIKDVKEKPPAFALVDEFEFALNNLIYPSLLPLKIGGIYGIDYAEVRYRKINIDINYSMSSLELDTPERRARIQFVQERVFLWGYHEKVVASFFMSKFKRYIPTGYDVAFTYDEDEGEFAFNTAGLRYYNYEQSKYEPITDIKKIEKIFNSDSNLRMSELLNYTILPVTEAIFPSSRNNRTNKIEIIGESKPSVQPNINILKFGSEVGNLINPVSNDYRENQVANIDALKDNSEELNEFVANSVENPVRMSPDHKDTVIIEFNIPLLIEYGIELKDLAVKLETYFSYDNNKITVNYNPGTNIIYLTGVKPFENPESDHYGKDVSIYVEEQLKVFKIFSDTLEQNSSRWFYNVEGNNLQDALAHPDVDARYTRSDNIVDVYRLLGVETCRAVALHEITNNVDPKINPVHNELLADAITYRTPGNKPLAQNKIGMTKRGSEFMARMFETTTEVAMEAGLGLVDNLTSLPAKIKLGILNSTGQLDKEDREEILKDKSLFRFDFPELGIQETPMNQVIDTVPIKIDAVLIKEESLKPKTKQSTKPPLKKDGGTSRAFPQRKKF